MVNKFSDYVTFRWYESVLNRAVEFKANSFTEFLKAVDDAAIDFRLLCRELRGTSYYYRPGFLEVSLHPINEAPSYWHQPRLTEEHDAMRLPSRGTQVTSDEAPSDSDIIKDCAANWWQDLQQTVMLIYRARAAKETQAV